jgi:hypothetical protein
VLVLSYPKGRHLFELVLGSVSWLLWLLWFGFLTGGVPNGVRDLIGKLQALAAENAFLWIFIVAPLISLPLIWRSVAVILRGESLSLEATTRTLARNGDLIAHFDQIEALQIRTIFGDNSRDYVLSVLLKDGGKIPVGKGADLGEMTDIADAMADIAGTKVVAK